MGGLDPPIQLFPERRNSWMAGSETGHGARILIGSWPRKKKTASRSSPTTAYAIGETLEAGIMLMG
jgi:hypothetical protein